MQYRNVQVPFYKSGNDPWVTCREGVYYYCWSHRGSIYVRRMNDMADLWDDRGACVWTPVPGSYFSRELWAPELHYLDGSWYIYVAADDGKNEHHRMLVLKGTAEDPEMPFTLVGPIGTSDDHWAIDGTVLTYRENRYFIWSGWEGDVDGSQNLYIARMADPTHLMGERVCISVPTYAWERQAMPLNEGPVCLVEGDIVHLVFSASGSWTDNYCIGEMLLRGGDPLCPANWVKAEKPLLSSSTGCFGPGHCSFALAPDGKRWIFYHANSEPNRGWDGRTCRAQPVVACHGDVLQIGKGAAAGEYIAVPVANDCQIE